VPAHGFKESIAVRAYEEAGLGPDDLDCATTIGGRIPVNPSGGLACFGEAVPAQAIAQVCELTWQLQGRAEGRQVPGARTGLSINQGLFGHGSAVIVTT
jgi:acetyl-CoA acetyltransferase